MFDHLTELCHSFEEIQKNLYNKNDSLEERKKVTAGHHQGHPPPQSLDITEFLL